MKDELQKALKEVENRYDFVKYSKADMIKVGFALECFEHYKHFAELAMNRIKELEDTINSYKGEFVSQEYRIKKLEDIIKRAKGRIKDTAYDKHEMDTGLNDVDDILSEADEKE